MARKAAVKKVAKKAVKKAVKIDIEKELATAHKILGEAAFQLVTMLATRKMSMTRVRLASEKARACADNMEALVQRLSDVEREQARIVLDDQKK